MTFPHGAQRAAGTGAGVIDTGGAAVPNCRLEYALMYLKGQEEVLSDAAGKGAPPRSLMVRCVAWSSKERGVSRVLQRFSTLAAALTFSESCTFIRLHRHGQNACGDSSGCAGINKTRGPDLGVLWRGSGLA